MAEGNLKGLVIAVFILFALYLIVKARHNKIRQKRKENGRFR